MDIPTESNWRSAPWDPDTPYAYDHFYGKDLHEASALIADTKKSKSCLNSIAERRRL